MQQQQPERLSWLGRRQLISHREVEWTQNRDSRLFQKTTKELKDKIIVKKVPKMTKSRSGSTSGDGSGSSGGGGGGSGGVTSDGRVGGVKKQCEECGGASPVACRICTACGADFFSNAGDKGGDSPSECSETDGQGFMGGERRRSERVKREKPDYYDALDFENKRKNTPTRGKRDKNVGPGRSPRVKDGEGQHIRGGRGGRGGGSSSGRATLTWKKGKGLDDDDDDRDRRRRKRPRPRDHDEDVHMMDELTSEKGLQCRVSLAEINRKMGVVMMQPS